MKIFIAYILSFIFIPIYKIIILIILYPFLFYAKKYRSELLFLLYSIIDEAFSFFVFIYISKFIFLKLAINYSIINILVFFIIFIIFEIVNYRIYRKYDLDELSCYLIGLTLGFFAGVLYFYNAHFKIISIVFIIPILIFIYFLRLAKYKFFEFWHLVKKNPDEAYEWFHNETCWIIFDPQKNNHFRPNKRYYAGPFKLQVPSLHGKIILIYGKKIEIEDSMIRFIKEYK